MQESIWTKGHVFYRILSAGNSILPRYFDKFLWISHLSFPILNDIDHLLKMKYIQEHNTTEEQTNITIASILHKTSRYIIY